MLDKINDEELGGFFAKLTKMDVVAISRYEGHATVIMENDRKKNFKIITFYVTDDSIRVSPKELTSEKLNQTWLQFVNKNQADTLTAND